MVDIITKMNSIVNKKNITIIFGVLVKNLRK